VNAPVDLPRSILLVEDNPGDADLIQDLLSESTRLPAIRVIHVVSLSAAMAVLRSLPVEAVLLDLRLPDGSGVQCVDTVRAEAHDVPIVVLTGLDDDELAMSCIAAGAQDYLSKLEVRSRTLIRAIDHAVARAREVLERRRSERLEREKDLLLEASRLQGEFVANMSHELRTPLNAIIGFSELIYDGRVDVASPSLHTFVGHILTSARHLLQLINDVLDMAKFGAGKIEVDCRSVVLATLIQEVADVMQSNFANKAIVLELDLDPRVVQAWADPNRLKQVLFNYLSNALKFTPEAGRVTIRTFAVDEQRFELEVEDSGVGIKAEDIGKLFSEFHQVRSSTGEFHAGTGLGLALTKRLVEAQGGAVSVRSQPGLGSVFSASFWRIPPTEARS